jgi:hypothetical protein
VAQGEGGGREEGGVSSWLYGIAAMAQVLSAPPAIVAAPTAAVSVDPVRVSAAEQLLNAMKIEQSYDSMFMQIIPLMTVQIFSGLKDNIKVPVTLRNELAKPEREAAAERIFAAEVLKGLKAEYPSMKAKTAREYASVFTVDELKQLSAFYASPVGQKTLTVMPQLQAKIMPIGMQAGRKVGEAAFTTTMKRMQLGTGKPNT